MRRLNNYVLFTLISIFLFSCDDDEFSPKTDFKEIYSLNCIINGDSLNHYASVLKSFDVKGLDPTTYDDNSFVSGANIKIALNNTEYIFEEFTETTQTNTNFETSYYFLKNLEIKFERNLEIEAILPNGNRLYSNTQVPNAYRLHIRQKEPLMPSTENNTLVFIWDYDEQEELGVAFLPKLKIYYSLNTEKDSIIHSFEVPIGYIDGRPEYPLLTGSGYSMFTNSMVDSAFSNLSKGDDNKSNYKIIEGSFEIYVLDNNLTSYYSSVHRPSDGFSVILNETEYTNIVNGRGIFGSYIIKKLPLFIYDSYKQKFGYRSR